MSSPSSTLVRLTYSRTSIVIVVVAVLLMLTGALLLTFTELGILAWALTLVGFIVELVAISRPRRSTPEMSRS